MKKGILVVSFGTTYRETRKNCIEAVEQRIREVYSQWEVRRAFSSNVVIKRIREKEGLYIDNPRQALERMKKEGFKKVIVQPLHLLAGEEYEKVCNIVKDFKNSFEAINIGKPLLYSKRDYVRVVDSLKKKMIDLLSDEKVIFMGHGTRHRADIAYDELQELFKESGIPAYIGTVEGKNTLESIIPNLKKERTAHVLLMPLMLVAGDHAINDMAGEEDSWKAILESEGLNVKVYLHGMGEDPHIQDIFVDHVKEAFYK